MTPSVPARLLSARLVGREGLRTGRSRTPITNRLLWTLVRQIPGAELRSGRSTRRALVGQLQMVVVGIEAALVPASWIVVVVGQVVVRCR